MEMPLTDWRRNWGLLVMTLAGVLVAVGAIATIRNYWPWGANMLNQIQPQWLVWIAAILIFGGAGYGIGWQLGYGFRAVQYGGGGGGGWAGYGDDAGSVDW